MSWRSFGEACCLYLQRRAVEEVQLLFLGASPKRWCLFTNIFIHIFTLSSRTASLKAVTSFQFKASGEGNYRNGNCTTERQQPYQKSLGLQDKQKLKTSKTFPCTSVEWSEVDVQLLSLLTSAPGITRSLNRLQNPSSKSRDWMKDVVKTEMQLLSNFYDRHPLVLVAITSVTLYRQNNFINVDINTSYYSVAKCFGRITATVRPNRMHTHFTSIQISSL